MKYLLSIILILFSLAAFAAIYMRTDSKGNITYSDTPINNAQQIELPDSSGSLSASPGNASPAISLPKTVTPVAGPVGGTDRQPYTTFAMVDPSDQETFQNQRDIPIRLTIVPALQQGDRVQAYVDGNPVGDATSDLSQLGIHQVDRGQHQISAALLDKDNNILMQTSAITIFIHYSAIPTGSGAIKTSL